ncbi:MAG: sigma-70 family RNA polymerase sigma factor [Pyrinomonadaceae bacterium]
MNREPKDITQLLAAWGQGDQAALDRLMPLVYGELRRLAHGYMNRQRTEHTLQTTALIHEAYLKLVGQPDKQFSDRAHFFGVAARAMRHILVDYARARSSKKRGEVQPISLEDVAFVSSDRAAELVALDQALTALARVDQRKSQVVEMRYFGGLSQEETAQVLKVSVETVKRDWRLAKLWLLRELSSNSE